jgi:hypothetical protein
MRILSGTKPNKERPLADRMSEAVNDCRSNMYFLSGMMYVMPKGTPMEQTAQQLLLVGWELLNSPNRSTAVIRHISKHGQRIMKLVKQVRQHTRQLDEDLASVLPKR